MKNFIRTMNRVLVCALIVVCICACGKDTAQYIQSEDASKENPAQDDTSIEGTEDLKGHSSEENMQEPSSIQQGELDTEENLLYVYVCGAVNQPGVYTFSEGSRVFDLFAAAGGLTEDAAMDYWNQAKPLADGEMFYVPTVEEAKDRQVSGFDTASQSTDTNTDDKNGKINLNTASLEELMEIPGIGEAKAKAILAYREEHGGFSSIEEVKNIEGIKDGVFSKMKEYIVIN